MNLETGILIVGGGATGLTASMLLSQYGIANCVVSKYKQTSPLPKAHLLSIKTMEMQRDAYASFNKMSESASKTMTDTAEAAVAATRGRTVKRAARKR